MKKIVSVLLFSLSLALSGDNFIVISPYFGIYSEYGKYDSWTDNIEYNFDLYTTGISGNGFFSVVKDTPVKLMANLNLGLPVSVKSVNNEIESSTDLQYPDQYGWDISGIIGVGYTFPLNPLIANIGLGISGAFTQYHLNSYSSGSVGYLGVGGSLQLIYMFTEKIGISTGITASYTPFNFNNSLLNNRSVEDFSLVNYSPYLGVALTL